MDVTLARGLGSWCVLGVGEFGFCDCSDGRAICSSVATGGGGCRGLPSGSGSGEDASPGDAVSLKLRDPTAVANSSAVESSSVEGAV